MSVLVEFERLSRGFYAVRVEFVEDDLLHFFVACDAGNSDLIEEGIGGAPVGDAEGHLLGIVSKTDLLCAWRDLGTQRDRQPLTAGDVMMPVVFALTEDSTVAEAAALMAYEGVHRLPIVDRETRVVGVVTTLDLRRWIAQSAGLHAPDIREIEVREV